MLTKGMRAVEVHTQLVQLTSPVPTTVRVGWAEWTVGNDGALCLSLIKCIMAISSSPFGASFCAVSYTQLFI